MNTKTFPLYLRIIGSILIIAIVWIEFANHDIRNIIWLCNISALLCGTGLLFGKPQVALVGATFMFFGCISWFLNVLVNHSFGDTLSYVTHFSFGLFAAYLFFRIPVERHLWAVCFSWYILSQVLSRLFTPASENINLAFSVWPGFDGVFKNFLVFWCVLTLSCLICLFLMNRLLYRRHLKRYFDPIPSELSPPPQSGQSG